MILMMMNIVVGDLVQAVHYGAESDSSQSPGKRGCVRAFPQISATLSTHAKRDSAKTTTFLLLRSVQGFEAETFKLLN